MTANSKPLIIKISALFVLILIVGFHFGKSAPLSANWQQQFQITPEVTLDGDLIQIKNFRDFRYSEDGSIAKAHYQDKQFKLSELKAVWLGLSHFGKFGLAHAFASFEFANNQFLVVSLEARLQQNQPHYNPLAGLFRRYTKFMVLGSEQDIIGLRSHIRKEQVYLYSLKGSQLQARALLLNFLRQTQWLNDQAEFYNTVSDNCLTGLLAESKQYRDWYNWIDYRILLPGYADRLLFNNGNIYAQESFQATQEKALVQPQRTPLEAEDFSQKIRYSP